MGESAATVHPSETPENGWGTRSAVLPGHPGEAMIVGWTGRCAPRPPGQTSPFATPPSPLAPPMVTRRHAVFRASLALSLCSSVLQEASEKLCSSGVMARLSIYVGLVLMMVVF